MNYLGVRVVHPSGGSGVIRDQICSKKLDPRL